MALWIGGEIYAAGGNKVALELHPGSAGVFDVVLDGELLYSKKTTGKYPDLKDAKEMKARVINTIGS